MNKLARLIKNRWRAIPILGLCQILSWGAIYYTPVLIAPLIAEERGWSLTFAMGGFSLGLFAAGLCSPLIGRMIDRHGGHVVMPLGSLLGAAGLIGIVCAANPVLYLAVWMVLGAAMAASLYDPAFATLARIFGTDARRAITLLTFIGGFASTVSWPATHFLIEAIGWRGTYSLYAALLALLAAPLLAFTLPREHAAAEVLPEGPLPMRTKHLPATGWAFALVAIAFAIYAFIPSALSAHMLAIFTRFGIEPATVVLIGALFGPARKEPGDAHRHAHQAAVVAVEAGVDEARMEAVGGNACAFEAARQLRGKQDVGELGLAVPAEAHPAVRPGRAEIVKGDLGALVRR